MNPTGFEQLTPESLRVVLFTTWGLLLLGLLLWTVGFIIARGVVASILGILGATVAVILISLGLSAPPLTAATIGFIAGALVGIFAFKWLQGLALALTLGILAAGIDYQIHITLPPASAPAASQVVPLPPGRLLPHAIDSLRTIPLAKIQRAGIVAAITAAITLLLAVRFPRTATVLTTAALGAMLTLNAIYTLLQIKRGEPLPLWPHPGQPFPLGLYLLLGILTLLGALIQWRIFLKKPDKQPQEPTATPA